MTENATKTSPKRPKAATEQTTTGKDWLQSLHPFDTLRHEIDKLFDDFDFGRRSSTSDNSGFELEPFWRRELSWTGMPAVDIAENEKAYELTAELPGMDQSNLKVQLTNRTLVIKGEKASEHQTQNKQMHLSERRYGAFERSFRLPDDVDAAHIRAQFSNGLLSLTLPRSGAQQHHNKSVEIPVS